MLSESTDQIQQSHTQSHRRKFYVFCPESDVILRSSGPGVSGWKVRFHKPVQQPRQRERTCTRDAYLTYQTAKTALFVQVNCTNNIFNP